MKEITLEIEERSYEIWVDFCKKGNIPLEKYLSYIIEQTTPEFDQQPLWNLQEHE